MDLSWPAIILQSSANFMFTPFQECIVNLHHQLDALESNMMLQYLFVWLLPSSFLCFHFLGICIRCICLWWCDYIVQACGLHNIDCTLILTKSEQLSSVYSSMNDIALLTKKHTVSGSSLCTSKRCNFVIAHCTPDWLLALALLLVHQCLYHRLS